jgi:hypothetical protein
MTLIERYSIERQIYELAIVYTTIHQLAGKVRGRTSTTSDVTRSNSGF